MNACKRLVQALWTPPLLSSFHVLGLAKDNKRGSSVTIDLTCLSLPRCLYAGQSISNVIVYIVTIGYNNSLFCSISAIESLITLVNDGGSTVL